MSKQKRSSISLSATEQFLHVEQAARFLARPLQQHTNRAELIYDILTEALNVSDSLQSTLQLIACESLSNSISASSDSGSGKRAESM